MNLALEVVSLSEDAVPLNLEPGPGPATVVVPADYRLAGVTLIRLGVLAHLRHASLWIQLDGPHPSNTGAFLLPEREAEALKLTGDHRLPLSEITLTLVDVKGDTLILGALGVHAFDVAWWAALTDWSACRARDRRC